MTQVRWGWVMLLALGFAVVQAAVGDTILAFPYFRIDLPLLLTVAVGFVAMPRDAARIGFAIGLSTDLLQFSPFGLYALLLTLAAWTLANLRLRMMVAGQGFRSVQGALAAGAVTIATRIGGLAFGLRPPLFTRDALISLASITVVGGVAVHLLMPLARRMLRDYGSRTSRSSGEVPLAVR